jgi:hypothetical protein
LLFGRKKTGLIIRIMSPAGFEEKPRDLIKIMSPASRPHELVVLTPRIHLLHAADDPTAPLPFRVETDRHGHILMSPPPAPAHGKKQNRIGTPPEIRESSELCPQFPPLIQLLERKLERKCGYPCSNPVSGQKTFKPVQLSQQTKAFACRPKLDTIISRREGKN